MLIKVSTNRKKKYDAFIKQKNGKIKKISFGARGYTQFKDQTGLNYYTNLDHNDIKRRRNFLKRMTNEKYKKDALRVALNNNNGEISAKYLAIKFLW